MFNFKFEPTIPLLTVTRTGFWSLATVAIYEVELRNRLEELRLCGPETFVLLDIRATGALSADVARALRMMVERLGPLRATRTAIVTSSGLAKLQSRGATDDSRQVFTSISSAQAWLKRESPAPILTPVYDVSSEADPNAEHRLVHVHGPSTIDFNLTPRAALESARRIGDAAMEVLMSSASQALSSR